MPYKLKEYFKTNTVILPKLPFINGCQKDNSELKTEKQI